MNKDSWENVSEESAQVKAVSERLLEVNQLPLEAPTYVFQGLTNCYVPEFTRPFEPMLNQEHVTQMGTAMSLVNTSSITLKRVLYITVLANNSYHSLNTSNFWNDLQGKRGHHSAQQPHHTPECLNFGEAHLLPDCKQVRDETKIARNRKAYMDKRPDGSHNNGHKRWYKGGRGGRGGRGGENPKRSADSGVQLMGNKWMCFCKRKYCGWNTTHTSGLYSAWMQNKSSFTLPMTHKFCVKTDTESKPSQKGELTTDVSTSGSLLNSSIAQTGIFAGIITSNKDSTKAVLGHYKSNAADIDLSALMADFHTAWGLN